MDQAFHLDIFEDDLACLSDEEFWEVWNALGKLIWARNHKQKADRE